jgi:hypothetical protein
MRFGEGSRGQLLLPLSGLAERQRGCPNRKIWGAAPRPFGRFFLRFFVYAIYVFFYVFSCLYVKVGVCIDFFSNCDTYSEQGKIFEVNMGIANIDNCIDCKKKIPAEIAKNARERAHEIELLAITWCARWGFVTDKTLQFLYPSRPRLGYDLAKRGLLKKIVPPNGVAFRSDDNSGFCYRLTNEAKLLIEKFDSPENATFLLETISKIPQQPAWNSLQHLFDLQKICVRQILEKNKDWTPNNPGQLATNVGFETSLFRFMTEVECRQKIQSDLVPDLVNIGSDGRWTWYEYDRSPKSDSQLAFWVQRLMMRKLLPSEQADPNRKSYIREYQERAPEIAQYVVVVTSEYQKKRYQQAFSRKTAEVLERSKDRKIKVREDIHRWSPRDFFGNSVKILTLEEALGTGV